MTNTTGVAMFSMDTNKFVATKSYEAIFGKMKKNDHVSNYYIDHLTVGVLSNFWAGVWNKKQLVCFNQDMVPKITLAADSNGIIDLKINQKSEELFTMTRDRK